MKTYLELEVRLGPNSRLQPQTQPQQTQPQQTQLQQTCMQQKQLRPDQPSTNPMVRKSPGPKTKVPDKRRNTMIAKRRYKVRALTQPTPSTPTSTAPTPTVATVSTPDTNGKVHSRVYTGDSI